MVMFMASHADQIAALQKAEAGTKLSPNEQFALKELAKVHNDEGKRAQAIVGPSGDGKGILGI
jgi:hypothetical protein